MSEVEQQRKERERQEDLQRLRGFRPIDDDFMRCLFKDNIPLAELVLRIIIGKKDLVITDCETQKDMKRLVGRVPFVWMHMGRILKIRNMTVKSKDLIRDLTHTVQDIIPVCWMLRIWM